ncbi:MAG: biliverdin-producing heme oxygenase [Pseudomonadota bacterium]
MVSETVARLRDATRDEHQRLEDSLDIFGRISRPDARRRMVERFHGLHAGAESALSPMLAHVVGLDFAGRSRLPFLIADVRQLGGDPDALPMCAVSRPASLAEALGVLYVLEGSTLGGHVIGKRLAAEGHSDRGLTFLDPYRDQVGARWRAFLQVLERDTASDVSRDAAVVGARTGFAMTQDWLCAAAEAA